MQLAVNSKQAPLLTSEKKLLLLLRIGTVCGFSLCAPSSSHLLMMPLPQLNIPTFLFTQFPGSHASPARSLLSNLTA